MRVVFIGPGIMPIPPSGWGAVESLVWDVAEHLKAIPGVEAHIVNTPDPEEIIRQVNALKPDVVHLQYDDFYGILEHIQSRVKFATSHYGYLEHPTFKDYHGYNRIFQGFIHGNFTICALSDGIRDKYIAAGCSPDKVVVAPNGANSNVFRYSETCKYPDRSMYLAKIEERKKQYKYHFIESLYFAGNIICHKFWRDSPRYLGEWSKKVLYGSLTDYANLVLLSDGEAHPLVVCEALICGLGVVVSRVAAANLDLTKPWITVIPDDKLDDVGYVAQKIAENREISVKCRADIREYALAHFSWNVRVEHLQRVYNKALA